MYALANDENGLPLTVPAGAFGWLVRRHGGGKGRPAAVYDGDGRPLVVALDATAADLVAAGVAAGRYRLDAVDDRRKQLGVVAYTEVISGGETEVAQGSASDAVMLALARSVEAMQRVQAERERVQAEMFMRLIERLAPVPMKQADDLKSAMAQVLEVQRGLKKLQPAEVVEPRNAASEESEEESTEAWWSSPAVTSAVETVAQQGMPVLVKWLWKKIGLSPEQMAELGAAGGAVESQELAEVAAKLEAVFRELTEEERAKAEVMLKALPPGAIETVEKRLLVMEPKAAAAMVRKVLEKPDMVAAVAGSS